MNIEFESSTLDCLIAEIGRISVTGNANAHNQLPLCCSISVIEYKNSLSNFFESAIFLRKAVILSVTLSNNFARKIVAKKLTLVKSQKLISVTLSSKSVMAYKILPNKLP